MNALTPISDRRLLHEAIDTTPPVAGVRAALVRGLWAGGCLLLSCALASCQCLPRGAAQCQTGGHGTASCQACGDTTGGCAAGGCAAGCETGGCGMGTGWSCCSGGGTCGPNLYLGCVDNWRVRRHARACADRAWHRGHAPGGRGSCHYREGFTQAFVDLAEGGDGTPPGVPPERYWWCLYRSSCGQRFAEEWFAGYDAGVGTARSLAFCPNPTILLGPSAGGAGSPPPDYTTGRVP
jgi:hypothetical protein